MPESGWKPSARWMTAPMPPHWCGTAAIWDTVPGGPEKSCGKRVCLRSFGTRRWTSCPRTESRSTAFYKASSTGRSPEDKEKKRLTDALLRRGFSWGEVKSAWGRYGSEIWEE